MRATNMSLAALVLLGGAVSWGADAAQAATGKPLLPRGFTVTRQHESLIHAGMTQAQVRQALGHPEQAATYLGAAGPTWTYEVAGARFGARRFDIAFDATGNVSSFGERIDEQGD